MDQGADIEQVINEEIEILQRSLRRLTEGPIPLRLWSKRAGGELVEETEEQIAHLRRTLRIYEAALADMNTDRAHPDWRQPAMAGGIPLAILAAATS